MQHSSCISYDNVLRYTALWHVGAANPVLRRCFTLLGDKLRPKAWTEDVRIGTSPPPTIWVRRRSTSDTKSGTWLYPGPFHEPASTTIKHIR